MKIGIVSCNKYKDKIVEDILLEKELLSRNIKTDIISWEQDSIDEYDVLIIRSIWGYQYKYMDFTKWLDCAQNRKKIIVNSYETIKKFIDKKVQFEILQKNNIPIIPYKIVDNSHVYRKIEENIDYFYNKGYNKIVIKPTISESGNFTYCFKKNEQAKIKAIIKEEEKMLNSMPYEQLIIQPFYEEVVSGEYSCIALGGKISRKMLRFTGKLYKKKDIHQVYQIDEDEKMIVKDLYKCIKAPYMRVDYIKSKGSIKIMEVEVIDPDLFSRNVDDDEKKQMFIRLFTDEILKEVNKNA